MKIVCCILLIGIISCNSHQSNELSANDSTSSINSSANNAPVKTDFTKDSVFTLHFPFGKDSVIITAKLNGINKPVTVHIPVTTGNALTVLLTPDDSAANIRINQLFMPDGKADGPFGKSLTRKINQQGTYTLIIGENLMQGDEWKGKFTVTVKVQ